jgi:hypothetical protein
MKYSRLIRGLPFFVVKAGKLIYRIDKKVWLYLHDIGYIVSSDKTNCPIFVTYHKDENI